MQVQSKSDLLSFKTSGAYTYHGTLKRQLLCRRLCVHNSCVIFVSCPVLEPRTQKQEAAIVTSPIDYFCCHLMTLLKGRQSTGADSCG